MVLLRHLLGDVLRRLRLRQGRTLREVSASARVSLGYLSEVERGQKEASSELLSAICTALDTPLSHVMREVSDNFALAELQDSPVLSGPREPVLAPAGGRALDRQVPPVLDARPAGTVLGAVRLSTGRRELRPGGSPLVPDDAAGLDHFTDTGDVSTMVPV
jgi:transcriptional regulator with XRE-family HTH domain